jgi:uncharacterized protein (TIGR01777 family)
MKLPHKMDFTMKMLVAGATGFVGRNLIPALLNQQHQITVIGRSISKIKKAFNETVTGISWDQLNTLLPDEFDVVINLAGENIAKLRWTKTAKETIKNSRIKSTEKIVAWCLQAKNKKPHLYNASAIGIYGLNTSADTVLTEASTILHGNHDDFLSEVGQAWENAVVPAITHGLPVTLMRFAVVLKRHEGILQQLELPYFFGMGSILGNGKQAFTWIHIHDLVSAIIYLINHPDITGPVNLASPESVSQKHFAELLASTVQRPLFIKMPEGIIKILFGQMGEELLLKGQNVFPERLKISGFEFSYPTLASALTQEWKNN